MEYNEMKSKLEKYNQTQILKAYDRANETTRVC